MYDIYAILLVGLILLAGLMYLYGFLRRFTFTSIILSTFVSYLVLLICPIKTVSASAGAVLYAVLCTLRFLLARLNIKHGADYAVILFNDGGGKGRVLASGRCCTAMFAEQTRLYVGSVAKVRFVNGNTCVVVSAKSKD